LQQSAACNHKCCSRVQRATAMVRTGLLPPLERGRVKCALHGRGLPTRCERTERLEQQRDGIAVTDRVLHKQTYRREQDLKRINARARASA
jgi:hypothetical protein